MFVQPAHNPEVLSLPKWEGWQWEVVIDTGAIAPFNCLIEDDHLPAHDLTIAKAEKAPWLGLPAYPMLPYSCIVLQAVQEDVSGPPPAALNVCEAPANLPEGISMSDG